MDINILYGLSTIAIVVILFSIVYSQSKKNYKYFAEYFNALLNNIASYQLKGNK